MEKYTKICQSCGMPLKKDPKGGSLNMDGSKNLKYCSYCYKDGLFTFKGSQKDFQEYCRKKMIEGDFSHFKAWLFTRGLSRLERWRNYHTLAERN